MGDVRLRQIGVVTTARSDFGILLPVLREIEAAPDLRLHLVVGGMHLMPEFGYTAGTIEAHGFQIGDRVEMMLASDTPLGTAKSIGLGVLAFAEAFSRKRPDILIALGDRFEMHSAVLAALPLGIPVAHIHGGEVTEGAIDDSLRHGITKIAHLHFAATQEYARRLMRMGEEPWRVAVSGAPALDNLSGVPALSRPELAARLGISFEPAPLLVTFHPVTRELERLPEQLDALLEALAASGLPIVFTLPNADPGGRLVAERIRAFAAARPDASVAANLGTQLYCSAMTSAAAMVGNSSSGIIEAASFALPVVNVGSRQAGRVRAANVIDVDEDANPEKILGAIRLATSATFRDALRGTSNPYAHGNAAKTIVQRLRTVPLDAALMRKKFYDG